MIQPTKLPSQKFLKECFRYERSTGKLFWLKRPRKHFVSDRGFKIWNKRWPGTEAFGQITRWGHRRGRVDGHAFLAHRVVWKIVIGKEPPDVIDHKDRNGQNNQWENLREATTSQNCLNNASKGISRRDNGKWRVRVTKDGKRFHVGDYSSKESALQARVLAHRDLNGEFAL